MNYLPLIITIGEKEKESNTLSVRTLDGKVRMGVKTDDFFKKICSHINIRNLEKDIL